MRILLMITDRLDSIKTISTAEKVSSDNFGTAIAISALFIVDLKW